VGKIREKSVAGSRNCTSGYGSYLLRIRFRAGLYLIQVSLCYKLLPNPIYYLYVLHISRLFIKAAYIWLICGIYAAYIRVIPESGHNETIGRQKGNRSLA
jgi:hypothetical protein